MSHPGNDVFDCITCGKSMSLSAAMSHACCSPKPAPTTRYCEHCCKRVPSEGNHTCRPPAPASEAGEERLVDQCAEICWLSMTSAMHLKISEAEKPIRYHLKGMFESGHASATAALKERLGVVRIVLEWYGERHRWSKSHQENAATDYEWDNGEKAREALSTLTAILEEK